MNKYLIFIYLNLTLICSIQQKYIIYIYFFLLFIDINKIYFTLITYITTLL